MVNTAYVTTIQGILKLAGMAVSLLAFICAIIPYWSTHVGGGWNQFSAIFTFIVLTGIFVIFLMDLYGQIPSFGLLNLLAHLILLMFNFIAFIIACVLAARYSHVFVNGPALIVAALLFAMLLGILAISSFFAFRDFQGGSFGSTTTTSKSTTVTTTTTVAA